MTQYPTSRSGGEKQEHPYNEKKEKRKQLLQKIRKRRAEVLKKMYKR